MLVPKILLGMINLKKKMRLLVENPKSD